MSEKSKFNVEDIELDEIFIINANITNDTGVSNLIKGKYKHTITLEINPAMSKFHKNILKLGLEFNIDTESLDGNDPVNIKAKFDIAYFFRVKDLDIFVNETDHTLDSDLIINLSNIAYSTSRGIIYGKCQGTILNKLVVPILPTSKIASSIGLVFTPN